MDLEYLMLTKNQAYQCIRGGCATFFASGDNYTFVDPLEAFNILCEQFDDFVWTMDGDNDLLIWKV